MKKKKPTKKRVTRASVEAKRKEQERFENRALAAQQVVRAWLRMSKINEHTDARSPDDLEASDVEVLDYAEHELGWGGWVSLRMFVPNLDIEMAEEGEHIDVNAQSEEDES